MRNLVLALLIGAAALPAAAAPPQSPRDCISNRDIRQKRMAPDTGYFVRTSAGWWHNTGPACSAWRANASLSTRTNNDRQCRGDVVGVFDPRSQITFGACNLGAWERVEGPPAAE